MNLLSLANLAVKHTRNHIAEAVYLNTGYDATLPITFYGLVNERCNVKCRFCEYWRMKEYAEEMTIEQWQAALRSIKDFVGTFSINFSGGEPFIKKGFLDLMRWCSDNGIHSGVTTNGSAFTDRNIEKLVAAKPFNVNVSIDAPDAGVHDYLRGAPGLFDKATDGIRRLLAARKEAGQKFPVVIKTVVNRLNFRLLPRHVKWADELGATAIHFQPMDEWTPETREELWVQPEEYEELERVQRRLLSLKREGAKIMNNDETIKLILPHFRKEKAPASALPCRIGMRDFFIRTNGDVELCFFFPPVGNVKHQSARDIWHGEKARTVRGETVKCDRLCLYTCLSQKTIKDKVRMALKLISL